MDCLNDGSILNGLEKKKYRSILCDAPWRYNTWSAKGTGRSAEQHYNTMSPEEISAIPVAEVAADDCILFLWVTWPCLLQGIELISQWGFEYRTCAFCWIKADATQVEMFKEDVDTFMGMGYYTRSNSEACLLGVRGHPKILDHGVRQAIIEPIRAHSRKPDCVYERIERLVEPPYLELFARNQRKNWTSVGNETTKYGIVRDIKTDNADNKSESAMASGEDRSVTSPIGEAS